MNLERRDTGGAPSPKAPGEEKKPVLIYILALLVVALLLMWLSYAMHKRSEIRAMGELNTSAAQEVQAAQEKIIALQDALSRTEKERDALQLQLETDAAESAEALRAQEDAAKEKERSRAALEALYTLQQEWLLQRYDDCEAILKDMEEQGLVALLSEENPRIGVTSPAMRYRQFGEALAKLKSQAETQAPQS